MPRIPGATTEVLEHHWRLHVEECPDADDVVNIECPCGCAVVQLCTRCHAEIFVGVDDGPCDHVAALLPTWGEWE
jgi:hypothetical protein